MEEEEIYGIADTQTYMIVWDVKLQIESVFLSNIDILTPLLCLNPNEPGGRKNWIRLLFKGKLHCITISSDFMSTKEFKGCTTYMLNPYTNKVLDVFKGFRKFIFFQHVWRKKIRFIFEIKMQCHSQDVQPVIWQRCSTVIKPPINVDGISLTIKSETINQKVLNNQENACLVTSYPAENGHELRIIPEKPSEIWNIFTIMLKRLENNVLEWYYLHTTSIDGWSGRTYPKYYRFIVLEIKELSTSVEKMEKDDIEAVSSIIETYLSPSKETKALHNFDISACPIFYEYFTGNKFCDVTVQIKDEQIQAHKVILAINSHVWHDLFNTDKTLSTVHVVDFDYKTIKQLIEYMYTGTVKQPMQATDQLLIASDTYGIAGLKKLCESQLIETIDLKNIVNLLVLADRYNASTLYEKVMEYIQENCDAFKKLDEAKTIFMMYPELGFKIFAQIA